MAPNDPQTSTRLVTEECYEPGNATSYRLCLIEPSDEDNDYLLVWLNAPGGGRAMRISADGIVHINYLSEKLGCNDADGTAILNWLRDHGVAVYLD